MVNAYLNFWKNYVNFEGKSTRSDYWFAVLGHFIVYTILFFCVIAISAMTGWEVNNTNTFGSLILLFIAVIYLLASIIPSIAIQIRRLRDGGFHWALIFINFIPYVGSIALFVLYCLPSKVNESIY